MKFLLIFCLFASLGATQSTAKEEATLNEKAARYHNLLLRRPDSGTLFERFVDSWLDSGSKEGLETFLTQGASEGGAPEWRLLATYLDWMGREEEALQAMSEALEKAPDDGTLFFARAKLKARLLNFEGALKDLEQSKDAAGEEAATLKGTWLARAGQPEEALAAWKELLAARPEDEELREDLVELQVGEGLYEEAVATGRELAENTRDPYQKALRLLRVAAVEVIGGKRDEGIATYRGVLRMTGESSWLEKEVLAQVEKVYQREEDVVGLRKFYQELREEFPQRVSLRKGLAFQMAANGEVDEAVELFREVLQITPGDLQNRRDFIALLEDVERYELAIEELQVVLRDSNDPAAEWERMARLRDLMDDEEGLLKALDKVRELRATDPAGVIATAGLYERYELREKTGEILRAGRAAHPEAYEVSEALASYLAAADSSDENFEEQQAEATELWLAMAEGADAEGLLRVARGLMAHQRAEPCFQLLKQRIEDFPENVLLLKQLCSAGLSADQAAEALPYGVRLARLAEAPTELTSALEEIVKLARRLDLEEETARFMANSEKTVTDWCILAELQELQGDSLASDAALAEAAKLSDGPLVLVQRIRLLEKRGQTPKAIEAVREMVARPGGERPINLRKLVNLLASTGDIRGALDETENWKRIAPGDKAAWIRRAELLGEMGELEEATDELRRASAKFGDEDELRSLLAAALVQAGDYTEGQRIYRKLYEDAEDATARSRWIEKLATLAQQENRVDELLEDFERRARRNSREAAPLQALARVHQVLNRPDLQREALAEAIRRKPDDLKLRLDLALVLEEGGEYETVLATLREAARLDSGTQAEQALSDFYFRNGELEKGLATLRGLQGGGPREVETTVSSLLQAGELEAAQDYLQVATEQDWRLKFLSALCLYFQNEKAEARNLLHQLVTITDEIEGIAPLMNDQIYQQWSGWMGERYPDENLEENILFSFMQQNISGYVNLLQNNRGNSSWSSRGSGAQPLALPGTAAEMRALAQSFLFYDASRQAPEQREEFLAAIPFPKSSFGTRMRNTFRKGEWYDEQLALGQIDLASVIRQASYKPEISKETLRRGYQELKESDPELAAQALAALSRKDVEDHYAIFQQRLALLESLPADEQNMMLSQMAAVLFDNRMQQNPGNRQDPLATHPEATDQLRALLLGRLAEASPPADALDMANDEPLLTQEMWFRALLMDTWLNGDAVQFVKLVNRKLTDHKILTKATPPGMISYNGRLYPRSNFYGQQGQMMTPVFPRQTTEIPYDLLSFFQQSQQQQGAARESAETLALREKWRAHQRERNRTSQDSQTSTRPSPVGMDEADLDAVVDQIESPLMRVLALNWSGNEELLEQEMTAFAESQDAEKMLWAAGYHFTNQNISRSYELLTKARFLPLDSIERQNVDLQLTMLGKQLAESGTDPGELEIARRAALRIRSRLRAPNQQQTIQKAMTSLGLGEIVLRMQNANLRRGVVTSRRNSSSRNRTSPQLERALAEGQREAAAREALRLMRSKLKRSNGRYELRRLLETIQTSGLQDEIMTLAALGDSRSQRMDFLALCDIFKKDELALPIARKILAERPDDIALAARLSRYLPEKERAPHIAPLMNAESFADFTDLIKGLVQQNSNSISIRSQREAELLLQACRLTERYLTLVEPDGEATHNFSWVLSLFNGAADDWYLDSAKYPSLDDAPPTQKALEKLPLQKERVRLVRALLSAALPHPQLAEQSFAILEGGNELYRPTEEELTNLAFIALAAKTQWSDNQPQINGQAPRNFPYRFSFGYYTSSLSKTWIGLDPASYLQRHYFQLPEEERAPLIARLREASPETARRLTLLNQFASGSDEESAAALAEWNEETQKDEQKREDELVRALKIILLAGAPESRLAILEDELFQILDNGSNNYRTWESLAELLESRYRVLGTSAFLECLERFIAGALGPRELWQDYRNLANQNALPAEMQRLRYSFDQLGRSLVKTSRDFPHLLAIASIPPLQTEQLGYQFREKIRELVRRETAEETIAALEEKMFWSLSWEKLAQPLSLQNPKENTWSHALSAIRSGGSKQRSALGKVLAKASGDHQLRKHLASLYVDRTTKKAEAFLLELEKEAPKLLALPKGEQVGIATLVAGLDDTLRALPKGEQTTALLETVSEAQRKDVLAEARQRLKDGFGKGLNDYEAKRIIFGEIAQIVAIDPAFAAEYLYAAIKDAQSKPNTQGNPTYTAHQHLEEFSSDNQNTTLKFLDFVSFLVAFQSLEDAPPLAAGMFDNYRLRQVISDFVDRTRARSDQLAEEEKDSFDPFWNTLIDSFPKEGTPSFQKTAVGLLLLYGSGELAFQEGGAKAWTNLSASHYAEKHPDFYRISLIQLAMTDWDDLPEAALKSARASFAELMQDSALAPNLRLSIVQHVGNKRPQILDTPEGVSALTSLFEEYASDGHPFGVPHIARCLSILPKLSTALPEDRWLVLLQSATEGYLKIVASTNISQERKTDYATAVLWTAILLDHQETIEKMLNFCRPQLRGDLGLICRFVSTGKVGLAKQLVAGPDASYREYQELRWGPELAGTLATLLPEIVNTAERFRIECLLTSRPNRKKADNVNDDYNERLLPLVARLQEEGPKSGRSLLDCLESLSRTDQTVEALIPELAKLAKRYNYSQALDNDTMPAGLSASTLRKLLDRYFVHLSSRGNLEPLDRHFRNLANSIGSLQNAYNQRRGSGDLFANTFDGLLTSLSEKGGSEVDPAILEYSKEWYRAFASISNLNDRTLRNRYTGFIVALHALAGQSRELDQWIGTLPQAEQKAYHTGLEQGFIIVGDLVRNRGSWSSQKKEKARRHLLTALINDPFAYETLFAKRDSILQTHKRYRFKPEELWDAIEAIDADHPHAWKLRYERAVSRLREKDLGYPELQEMLQEAIDDGEPFHEIQIRGALINGLMNRQKDPKGAVEMYESIDWSQLPKDDKETRKWLEDLGKNAKKKLASRKNYEARKKARQKAEEERAIEETK